MNDQKDKAWRKKGEKIKCVFLFLFLFSNNAFSILC